MVNRCPFTIQLEWDCEENVPACACRTQTGANGRQEGRQVWQEFSIFSNTYFNTQISDKKRERVDMRLEESSDIVKL